MFSGHSVTCLEYPARYKFFLFHAKFLTSTEEKKKVDTFVVI